MPCVAVGKNSCASGPGSIAFGASALARGGDGAAIAIGYQAKAIGKGAIAIGDGVVAEGDGVVVVMSSQFKREDIEELAALIREVFIQDPVGVQKLKEFKARSDEYEGDLGSDPDLDGTKE